MLSELKDKGILIGLISNCFSEEADVIRRSELFSYFDAVYLSYEQGLQKPDEEIYRRCMDRLGVKQEECLYIGDGGSNELEAARKLGMKAAFFFFDGWFDEIKKLQGIQKASANATLVAFLDRLFYSTGFDKTMKVGASVAVARNMSFLMKSIALGKEKYGLPEKEAHQWTNFIR